MTARPTGFYEKANPKGAVTAGDRFASDLCGSYPLGSTFLTPAGRTYFGPVLATVRVERVTPTDVKGINRIEGVVTEV